MLLLILLSLKIFAAPDCPTNANLNPNTLQPEVIRGYINTQKLTSPEDLVCCIAKMPNIEIAISPHSIAGQNGDYLNPRVLIINRATDGSINAMFSINSGKGESLTQKNSVEMMYNDRAKGEVAYSDIDFNGPKGVVSARNPEACMSCHGDGSGVPPGGPKVIFDTTPWPRFMMESPDSLGKNDRAATGQHLCPEREKLEPLFEAATNKALNEKPRYACIKDKPRIGMLTLDDKLQDLNIKRLIKFMRSTPDYSKYKYSILGAEICGNFVPENYFPTQIMANMTNQDTLAAPLRRISAKNQLLNYLDEKYLKNTQEANIRDKAKKDLASIIKGNKPVDLGNESDDTRSCMTDERDIPKISEIPPLANHLTASSNSTFNRYSVDSYLKYAGEPEMRFIFESRGINIADWSMSPTGAGDYSRAFNFEEPLKATEPQNSDLRIALAIPDKDKKCRRLQELSLKAFQAPNAEGPAPESNIVQ